MPDKICKVVIPHRKRDLMKQANKCYDDAHFLWLMAGSKGKFTEITKPSWRPPKRATKDEAEFLSFINDVIAILKLVRDQYYV